MMRLMKWAVYGLLGYAAFEFCRGLIHDAESMGGGSRSRRSRALDSAQDRDPMRTNMTGPGRGERIVTEDGTGESVPHSVGRGVVQ